MFVELLQKAQRGAELPGHKYLARVPDGKGGWDYKYVSTGFQQKLPLGGKQGELAFDAPKTAVAETASADESALALKENRVFTRGHTEFAYAEDAKRNGLRMTGTLRQHVRPDNETKAEDVPLTSWILRGSDNPYGKYQVKFVASKDAKILVQGSKSFKQIAKGLKDWMLRTGTAAPDVVTRAAKAGYDAVEFEGTDIGTVVINRSKFKVYAGQ